MRSILQNLLIISCLVTALQGCESLGGPKDPSSTDKEYAGWDAEKFHIKAKESMEASNYQKAIELYETLESRYPFGEYAAQAQLDIAYAYYKNDDPDASIAAANRFIKVNPTNPSVDYAYYLKGLVNFNRSIGFIERFLPTDASQRNPSNVKDAHYNFTELVRRFPESQYVPDAKQRMLSLKNNLAMYEVHVARFYLKRKAYIAAANRGGYVINEYQRTPAVPYALLVMQEAYTKLNMTDLAADAERVYKENYPNGAPIPELDDTTAVNNIWSFFGFDQ
ncbi:MAG: outer membrane protein assembly factor BamD [Methylococcales bacterium]|nr:outer membrane protein assembly factor BamD [Methylococcales bacterium]